MLTACCLTYVALLSLYLANDERRRQLWPGSPLTSSVFAGLGWAALVHLDVAGAPVLAQTEGTETPKAGDNVSLELAPAALHVFDRNGHSIWRGVDQQDDESD